MNKKALAVAIAGALAVPMTAQAVQYSISGHVNRMIRFVDDGQASDIQHVDNGASSTRFRIKGSEDIGNGMKAGVYIESAVASASSSAQTLKTDEGFDTAFNIRHSALWFEGNWGKVTLGHTSEASDGVAFADLSNTWLVNEVSSVEHLSGVTVRTTGGGGSGVAAGSGFNSFDGGRRDVLRYDSPALGPATVAVSVADNSRWAAGVFVSTSLGGGELSANAGYTDFGGTSAADSQWAASASYLFSQGTSITLMYGQRDVDGRDPETMYIKLGHQWGNHAVSIHYLDNSDIRAANEDNNMWGLGWVYTMRKDIEIYAGYNSFEFDAAGAEDIDEFVVGTRVKF